MLLAVERGFLVGDLLPFANYLNAGHPVDDILRGKLARAIQTGKLSLKTDPGRGNPVTKRQTERRNWEIGEFVLRNLRFCGGSANAGEVKAIIYAAAIAFGVSNETARKAYQAARRRVQGLKDEV